MPDTSTSSTNGDSKDETPNTTISAFHVKTKEVTLKNGIHISLQTDATINATSYMSDNVTSDGGIHVRGKGGEVAEFFNATGIDLEPQVIAPHKQAGIPLTRFPRKRM